MRSLLSRLAVATLATAAATAAHAEPRHSHHRSRSAQSAADRTDGDTGDSGSDATPSSDTDSPASDTDANPAERVVVVNAMPRLGALDQIARLRKVLDARGLLYKLPDPVEATLDGRNSLIADMDQIKDRYGNNDFKGALALVDADEQRLLHDAVGSDLAQALASLAQWRGLIADARGQHDEAMRQFRAAYRLDPASRVDAMIVGPRQREMMVSARHELSDTGMLHVEADPSDARISIDGGQAEHRHGDIELPLGIHLVVISAPNRQPYAELVDIRADSAYPLKIRLEDETEVVRAARLVDETAAAPAGKPRLARAGQLARLTHDQRILIIEDGNEHHITLRLYDVGLGKVSRQIELGDDAPSALIARKIRAALDPDNLIDADGIVVHIGSEQMHWYQHWYVWAGAAAVVGGTVAAFELANRAPTRIEGF